MATMAPEVFGLLPEWLTEDFISDVLRKGKETNLQYKILDVASAAGPGENYLGSVLRITVECNSIQKSLVVKILQKENEDSKFVSSYGVFDREVEMYNKILPKLYSTMQETLARIEYFSPYFYQSNRSDTIILEDLKPLGYKMVDRKEQLDMDHTLIVLTILAKIHAFSYIMGPETYKHCHDTFYSKENRHLSEDLLISIVKSFCRTVEKWEGYEKYASALWRFSKTAVDHFNEAVSPREGSFCVLNHGDCWTNNILFQYCPETGKLQDVKLIDFQQGRYGSPVLDLINFFYSSLRLDVWRQQDKLLRHYHNELIRWLLTAGISSSVYTFQDLQKDMKEKLACAISTTCTLSSLAFVDSENAPDLEKLFYENRDTEVCQYHKAHNTESYCERVREFLPYFEEQGLLGIGCD